MDPWKLEPARDTGLTPAERFRSVRREKGLLESLAHHSCFGLLRIYFSGAHRLKIYGREHLPRRGPFLLAANHCSHLDALALMVALSARQREKAFPIAAGDVFFQSPAASALSAIALNALPMWRKNCGTHALIDLRRKLQEEECIFIIFPEGSRSRDGEMVRFKRGLGMLAADTAVPVIPACIAGTFQAWPPHRRFPRPFPVKIIIGPALAFSSTPNDREGWNMIATEIETAVRGLKSHCGSC
jgi:1-acyl-sn-glycerol-3-phosphate acyltransferase